MSILKRRNVLLLSLLSFLIMLGFSAISPVIPYYILYLGGGLTELPEELGVIRGASEYAVEYGLLMSAFMLTRAFTARFFGSMSDRTGRKKLIILGSIMYTLLTLAYIFSHSIFDLYLIRAVQGVASAMVWPVAEALLMDTVPSDVRGRTMALYMMSGTLAMIGGPAIGVGVYKIGISVLGIRDLEAALKFPFLGLALIASVSIPVSLLLREDGSYVATDELISGNRVKDISDLPKKIRRSIRTIYVMALANGFAMGFVAPIMTLYIIQFISSDPAAIAVVTTISGLVGFLAAYPGGRLSDAVGRRYVIITSGLVSRFTTLLIPFVRDLLSLTLISTFRSVAFNIYMPAFRALRADLTPKEIRGKVFGTTQAMFNLGAVIGPLLGGQLYKDFALRTIEIFGFSLPGASLSFFTSAAIGFFTLALFIMFVEDPTLQSRRPQLAVSGA